jgi:hexosaminidase
MTIRQLKRILVVPVLFLTLSSKAQIIPTPVKVEYGKGIFLISNTTSIGVPSKQPAIAKAADYLATRLQTVRGFKPAVVESLQAPIQFILNGKPDTRLGKEGYTLNVTPNNVTVQANSPAGIFYGVQTMLQLLPKEVESKTAARNVSWHLPVVTVIDYPRFAWRGIMLDVSRHFFPKEYVKNYIDQLARYKFNRLHWHLTDDNGWRIEIKSLPKLTEVGAWRVPRTGVFGLNEAPQPGEAPTYGGFYSQEDIKEVVQYAKERYIEILPEVDVPGHSMAAIAAYPELAVTKNPTTKVDPGSSYSKWFGDGKFEMYIDNTLNPTDEKVYQFLDKVFTEVATLFPFEYIHMGGDECYKGYWERDANVQAFMKKNNLKNGEELQSYFSKRVARIITAKKKKVIGWDEILEGGVAPGVSVMSWRGTKGGIEASHLKHPVVMSPAPMYYLDMRQGDPAIEPPVYNNARLKDVYAFDPFPAEMDTTYVLGGQANLWTEQIPSTAQVEYMTYPRAFAVSETMWSNKKKKDWNGFVKRVEGHFERFDQAGINYARSIYDPIIKVTRPGEQLVVDITTEVEGLDVYYTLDNTIPNQYYPKYSAPITLPKDVDMVRFMSYRNGKPIGRLISIKTEDLEKRVTTP